MAEQTVHGVVFRDPVTDQWVAICLEYGVVTQGDSEDDAFDMLRDAVELHLEDLPLRERELTYQPVASEPTIRRITFRAEEHVRTGDSASPESARI
jgi:predicted RNase H-like HicB family nuclease